jgi:hypothetical protein
MILLLFTSLTDANLLHLRIFHVSLAGFCLLSLNTTLVRFIRAPIRVFRVPLNPDVTPI